MLRLQALNPSLWLTAFLITAFTSASAQDFDTSSWSLENEPGFGVAGNVSILSLEVFENALYAGTYHQDGDGADLYQFDGSHWQPVIRKGFGSTTNEGITDLIVFGNTLYAATQSTPDDGGQLWASGNGASWAPIILDGFGDPENEALQTMIEFQDQLYVTTVSNSGTHGAEIWRLDEDKDDWIRLAENGFGDIRNSMITAAARYGEMLYVGTFNIGTGAEVWRSSDGETWNQVNDDGFGNEESQAASAFAEFEGALYVAVQGTIAEAHSAELWRCGLCDGTDWTPVGVDDLEDFNDGSACALEVFDDQLYLFVGNAESGMEVWRSDDGDDWTRLASNGLGNAANVTTFWDNANVNFSDRLYVGTVTADGLGEVRSYPPKQIFLPAVRYQPTE